MGKVWAMGHQEKAAPGHQEKAAPGFVGELGRDELCPSGSWLLWSSGPVSGRTFQAPPDHMDPEELVYANTLCLKLV